MYARLHLFTLGPGMLSTVEKLAAEVFPIFKAQNGFKGITFLADDAVGEYGGFSLWESKEDGEAASDAIRPKVEEAVGDILKGPPTFRVFEVIEPNE